MSKFALKEGSYVKESVQVVHLLQKRFIWVVLIEGVHNRQKQRTSMNCGRS